MTDVSNDERFERYRDAIWGEANTNAAVGAVMAVADAEIASAKAAAWDEGANAAVRPFVKDARATLDAVIPFPDNPHRADEIADSIAQHGASEAFRRAAGMCGSGA